MLLLVPIPLAGFLFLRPKNEYWAQQLLKSSNPAGGLSIPQTHIDRLFNDIFVGSNPAGGLSIPQTPPHHHVQFIAGSSNPAGGLSIPQTRLPVVAAHLQ